MFIPWWVLILIVISALGIIGSKANLTRRIRELEEKIEELESDEQE